MKRSLTRAPGIGSSRGGLTMVELVISAVLLGAVMLVTVPTLALVADQRRSADRRMQAQAEAENVMERLTTLPFSEIDAEAAGRMRLSDRSASRLPDGSLRCTAETDPERPQRKRVLVEIAWRDRHGQPAAPVRLVSWVYRTPTGGPP